VSAAGTRRGRLRRSDCSDAGLGRRRQGRGFTYVDADGARVDDEETLARIRELSIPPAWEDVWVCPDPLGHIQATGIDAAGRKQYLYHERWQRRAAARKFAATREFAAKLPRLRRAVKRDLARDGMPRERALACAVRLLDLGFFRIGGEEYAESNESFGVATLLREHVSIDGDEVVFDFPAKSGQRRVQSIRDGQVRKAIEAMRRRRSGPEDLLVFREDGGWRDVRSEDVNGYIQDQAGDEYSAKDFRTCTAPCSPRPSSPASGRRARRARLSARSKRRSRSSPSASATPRPYAGAPTSIPGCSMAGRSGCRRPPPAGCRKESGPRSSGGC
jgi:DNA topoisomerase I